MAVITAAEIENLRLAGRLTDEQAEAWEKMRKDAEDRNLATDAQILLLQAEGQAIMDRNALVEEGQVFLETQNDIGRIRLQQVNELIRLHTGPGRQALLDQRAQLEESNALLAEQLRIQQEGGLAMVALKKAGAKLDATLGNVMSKMISIATEAFNAQKSFERAFQMPEAYTHQLSELHDDLAIAGVSMGELTAATGDLITNVSDFTLASTGQRKALTETTALLGELGVASSDVATGVQNSMKMFGQSIEGAEHTARELYSVAQELNVVPGQMAAEYAQMGPALAKFGNMGVKAFKDLARIQKLTGMEMNKVLQLTAKFDTFEEAAETTGKLNAALGGNFVNAMDMMMETDPAARFESIRGSLENAGLSFDTMSYYQKQFYTEALGLGEVGDLALMMSGRTDLMTSATEASAASQIEMAEQSQNVMNIQEEFQAIIAANSTEIIEMMRGFQGIVKAMLHLAPLLKWIMGAWALYKVAMFGATLANLTYTPSLATLTVAQIASEQASRRNVFMMVLLALALTGIGLALILASPSKLALGMVAFALALYLTAKILNKAVPAMYNAGSAMFYFGGALWVIIPPIALLIASMALLAWGIGKMAEGFAVMFGAVEIPKIIALGLFFTALGLGAGLLMLAALGIGVFASSMIGLGLALFFVSSEKLESIATIMESMSGLQPDTFSAAASGIRSIASALDDISVWKLMGVADVAKDLSESATALSKIEGSQATQVAAAYREISNSINDLPMMKTTVLTAGFGAMALAAVAMAPLALAFGGGAAAAGAARGATGGRTNATTNTTNTGAQQITVKLELDGKVLEERVVNIMGEQYQPMFAGEG
jgi:hypothetical protein